MTTKDPTKLLLLRSVLIALLALSLSALASDGVKAGAPNIANGEAFYALGDPARNIPACVSCHGAEGNSVIAQFPSLAGQHEKYLSKQLTDLSGADRDHAIMSGFAKAMTQDDTKNVTAYLAALSPMVGAGADGARVARGKKIYRAGIAEKKVPACAACHSQNGAGMPDQYPRIGGQHQDYTTAQLIGFRSGERKNSAQMTTIAKRMSDEEMKAVADYIAGLR